ncbi:Programmed cell death toxin YdcE, partial [uncultured Rubrobacteraceae bacterium]
ERPHGRPRRGWGGRATWGGPVGVDEGAGGLGSRAAQAGTRDLFGRFQPQPHPHGTRGGHDRQPRAVRSPWQRARGSRGERSAEGFGRQRFPASHAGQGLPRRTGRLPGHQDDARDRRRPEDVSRAL